MVQINIMDEIKDIARVVDDYILTHMNVNLKSLHDASLHYIINGGKRLRPFLAIKSYSIFNKDNMDVILPIAVAIELTHNFTLIHDDIMDNDNYRHGVPTVHKAYSMPLAILAGDLLIVKAFHLITENSVNAGLDNDKAINIIKRLAESCMAISIGQVLDISFAKNDKFPSINEYIEMIKMKTGALFEVSAEIGAIAANASMKDIKNLKEYGMNIGIAFQLIDDLIGVAGDSALTKKPVGNDIKEGKKTLPLLLALERVSKEEREHILSVFGNKHATNSAIKHAIEIIINSKIDELVRLEAKNYVDNALASIQEYKDSNVSLLKGLATFVVERML
jgi:geranylgeranyl diphosphate synthase type I